MIPRIIVLLFFILLSFVFWGCGSDGSSNWNTDENRVVRVSNLKGRVIAPIDYNNSARQSAEAYFSLLTTEGTEVFIEDNNSLRAVADVDGFFIIPNVPEGKHRVVANVKAGTTSYRQRSDVIAITGQYETQEMPYSIELSPALYNVKIYLNDLTNGNPVLGKVNIWGFTYDSVNGVVDIGPFPAGSMSKEARITAIGYRDLNTLINFGEDFKSDIYIKMTPTIAKDVNQAPVVAIEQKDILVKTNQQIELNGMGMDPEGDVITWKWSSDNDKGSFSNVNALKTTYTTPAASGTVRLSLIGTDSRGAAGMAMLLLQVEQGGSSGTNPNNKPPVAPNTPFPEDLSVGMDGELTLTWSCNDPNNDEITYTVNFAKQGSDMKTIATNLSVPGITVKDLEANTTYYWQVTAYDSYYASSDSDMWQFTTGDLNNQSPYTPTNPTPIDNAKDIGDHITFAWSGGDPDGDSVTYKIYLATASTWVPSGSTGLNLIESTNKLQYYYSGLAKGATYQWQIISIDSRGAREEGPIWQFSTIEPENNMPSYALITEPANGATKVGVNQKLRWTATDEDGDTLFYDVYFGTASEPPLVSASQPSQIYDPGVLEKGTTYYWRIVVSDGKVSNPESEIWSFSTEEIIDAEPYLVSITTPSSANSPLRLEFSEYINNIKQDKAFSFSPEVYGNWNWSEGNTVAEFMPDGGWLPGSYNKFILAENVLEDATGKLLADSTEKKFDIPSSVKVPEGYHSYSFPMKLKANQTVSISVPDLKKGKSSYIVAISDGNSVNASARANQSMDSSMNIFKDDPTYALRLEEAKMITDPIVVPQRDSALRAVVSSAAIGDTKEFYLNSVATSTTYPNNKFTATLTKMSDKTLVYVDNAITDANKESTAQNVLTTFDNRVIQQVRNTFGNEPEFGIDGESRISIVLVKIESSNSTAGYFYNVDLYPRSKYRESNEGKIFYIKYGMADTTTFGTLAHEFQHMINYYQKNKTLEYSAERINEDTWLNEALSKYSEEVCGYSMLQGDVNTTRLVRLSMVNNDNLSLTKWGPETLNCYGQVYLFMHFLAYPGRYNSDSTVITKSLVNGNGSALVGKENVEAVTGEPFKETVAKYALSLFLNNYDSSSPTAYGINNINLSGSYNGISLPGYAVEIADNPVSLSGMPYDNSIKFYRRVSEGKENTTISITAGTQPATLWLFDERD